MTEEQDPSPAYLKAFNNGYLLAKHEPQLLDKLLSSQAKTENEYLQAMAQGKQQFEHEKMVDEIRQVREKHRHTIRRKR